MKSKYSNLIFLFKIYSKDEIFKVFDIETMQAIYNELANNKSQVLHKDKLYIAIMNMLSKEEKER